MSMVHSQHVNYPTPEQNYPIHHENIETTIIKELENWAPILIQLSHLKTFSCENVKDFICNDIDQKLNK